MVFSRSMRPRLAAKIFIALTTVVVAFQLALAAGAPWGELTMGSAVLLGGFGLVVAARAGLALPRWRRPAGRLIWVVVAYTVVGVGLNAATPSARERVLWLPVALVLAACALLVARSSPEPR
jgi:hypothetical protein